MVLPAQDPGGTAGSSASGSAADFGTGPVRLGTVTFAWGPYRVQRVAQPNVYRQHGVNAWLLNYYGWLPRTYTLEGYATEQGPPYWRDPSLVAQLQAQFPRPTSVVPLLVPYQGIATTVRLIRLQDETDSTRGPGEVTFRLELEEADGPLTVREGASA